MFSPAISALNDNNLHEGVRRRRSFPHTPHLQAAFDTVHSDFGLCANEDYPLISQHLAPHRVTFYFDLYRLYGSRPSQIFERFRQWVAQFIRLLKLISHLTM
jgi:hypothetical protein